MEGLRPNRPELRRMLYAIFPEEVNNVVDIQFMGKGCYHLECSDHFSVGQLLEIKHTSLEGACISFYNSLLCLEGIKIHALLRSNALHRDCT